MDIVRLNSDGRCRKDKQCFQVTELPPGSTVTLLFERLVTLPFDPEVEFLNEDTFCLSVPDGLLDLSYLMTVQICPPGVTP